MSTFQDGDYGTVISGAALVANRRVRINSSAQAVYAGADELHDGVTLGSASAQGQSVAVKWREAAGTFLFTASAAVTAGGLLYGAADGKVSSTPTDAYVGRALEAASADNAVLEGLPDRSPLGRVFHTRVTVSSAQAAANSTNGQVDIDTGFGAAPRRRLVTVYTATTGRVKSGYDVTDLTSADAGKVRVAGVAAGVQIDENDVIDILCIA